MTISAPNFTRLQDGIKSVDDLRVRGPLNVALAYLSGSLVTQLNTHFGAVSTSISAHISVYASNRPTFSAHKNGTGQTSITSNTDTKVTFGTEDWDVGGHFSDSTYTPPAGRYRLSSVLTFTSGTADGGTYQCKLYKNGSQHRIGPVVAAGAATAVSAGIGALVESDGNDTFEIYARGSTASLLTISGSDALTWFSGEAIS
jgi:hypothetical protein